MELAAQFIQPNYLVLIASVCILGGIALFMYSILKRESEIQGKEAETFRRYHKILKKAHIQARALLATTSVASAEIISESHATNENIEVQLDKVLQNMAQHHIEHMKLITDEFTKSYEAKLAALQEQLNQQTERALQESASKLNQSLDQAMLPVVQSATASHTLIEQRTQESIAKVEQDLAEYKKIQMERIEKEVKDLVQKTYKEVLQRSIPENVQDELIMESLEKAKTEGGIAI